MIHVSNRIAPMALVAALLVLSACAGGLPMMTPLDSGAQIARGHDLAEERCSTCHAIGPSGDSPVEAAPAWREIHDRFTGRSLNAVLSQGISHTEPRMPSFDLSDGDANALAAYLRSIQAPLRTPSR